MKNITKRDIIVAGKVLILIAERMIDDPEYFFEIIADDQKSEEKAKKHTSKKVNTVLSQEKIDELSQVNLYERAKECDKETFEEILVSFQKEELIFLMKLYSFPVTKTSHADDLAKQITEHVFKRNVDVFVNQ